MLRFCPQIFIIKFQMEPQIKFHFGAYAAQLHFSMKKNELIDSSWHPILARVLIAYTMADASA